MQKLTNEVLIEVENSAKRSLIHKDKQPIYILVRPEHIVAMVSEIRELRKLANSKSI